MADPKFFSSAQIYVYPSANANDNGDVNTEINIAGISDNLICKNFILRRDYVDPQTREVLVNFDYTTSYPFEIELHPQVDTHTITLKSGEAIIDGRYVNFKTALSLLEGDPGVDIDLNDYGLHDALYAIQYDDIHPVGYQTYNDNYNRLLHEVTISTEERAALEEFIYNYSPHIILNTYKNTTGNITGDLTIATQNGNIVENRGVGLLVVQGWHLSEYPNSIDLGWISGVINYTDPANPVFDNGTQSHADDFLFNLSPLRYVQIDENSISLDNQMIKQYIANYVESQINSTIDALIIYGTIHDNVSGQDVPYRHYALELYNYAGNSARARLLSYAVPTQPLSYDNDGNVVVTPDKVIFDASSNGSQITTRSLIVKSPQSYSSQPTNTMEYRQSSSLANLTYTASDQTEQQVMDYDVASSSLNLGNTNTYVNGSFHVRATDQSPDTFTVDTSTTSATLNGSLTVKGSINSDTQASYTDPSYPQIQGFKVYGACWNDYAELYKKHNPEEVIESGTLISKVKGEDGYTTSSWINRKLVVGICSDNYGMILGGDSDKSLEENLKTHIPVAVCGQVKVKVVQGKVIEEGDLLSVSAVMGRASNYPNPAPGTIIGKALESSKGDKDRILVQVMLK